jgi:hypothetical protein
VSPGDAEHQARLRTRGNLEELTGELRVVVTGVQVLFAFLLIVPFDTGFAHVGRALRHRLRTRRSCPSTPASHTSVVPFDTGFAHVGSFERAVYFITLILATLAAACMIAPSAHHRFLFRYDDKAHLVFLSNRVVIAWHFSGWRCAAVCCWSRRSCSAPAPAPAP